MQNVPMLKRCLPRRPRLPRLTSLARVLAVAGGLVSLAVAAQPAPSVPAACPAGTLYLTFDTGSMSQAALIADVLRRHHIKATFFLANEPTVRKDQSLDPT